ncbi:MAG: secretin N-terminal domain-containing protein, partial [Pirellula sp.]
MRKRHTLAAWFCLLLLLAACDWLMQVGCAQPPAQQSVNESNLVRKEIPASPNQWLSLRQTLALHYPKQVFAHPAKPEALILQVGKESLLVEFDPQGRMLRIEGASKEVQAVSRLSVAHTTESQVSKDRAFRYQKLGKQGQVAMAAFSQNLTASKDSTAAPTGVRLASGTQEPAGAAPSDAPQSPPDRLPLPQFEGVQIEMLPELDAVILRGRDQQLTDLSEIIKRLDEASRESKPTIEVVPLQHVNSQSMSELIEDVQEKFIGTRQGRVTVSPLVSPNALLVIGWGESMDLMKQLIQQLDQPTKNESTLAVIPLKHAAASDVQTQLQSFYKGKDGLAPVVNSFADSRSNAIIVNGSPRDIAE